MGLWFALLRRIDKFKEVDKEGRNHCCRLPLKSLYMMVFAQHEFFKDVESYSDMAIPSHQGDSIRKAFVIIF